MMGLRAHEGVLTCLQDDARLPATNDQLVKALLARRCAQGVWSAVWVTLLC